MTKLFQQLFNRHMNAGEFVHIRALRPVVDLLDKMLGRIGNNEKNIQTNTTNISNNKTKIDANIADIDTNEKNIQTNTTNISNNKTKIDTNIADIKANRDAVDTVTKTLLDFEKNAIYHVTAGKAPYTLVLVTGDGTTETITIGHDPK